MDWYHLNCYFHAFKTVALFVFSLCLINSAQHRQIDLFPIRPNVTSEASLHVYFQRFCSFSANFEIFLYEQIRHIILHHLINFHLNRTPLNNLNIIFSKGFLVSIPIISSENLCLRSLLVRKLLRFWEKNFSKSDM